MVRVNSLKKGRRFERFVAKLLSKTFKIPFHRVPASGAFSTTNQINDPRFKGDVFTENKKWNKIFNVVIECKTTRELSRVDWSSKYWYFDLWFNKKVKKWLEQCYKEARGRNFWLFVKQDYKPIIIIEGLWDDKIKEHFTSEPMRHNHFLKIKQRIWKEKRMG